MDEERNLVDFHELIVYWFLLIISLRLNRASLLNYPNCTLRSTHGHMGGLKKEIMFHLHIMVISLDRTIEGKYKSENLNFLNCKPI